MVQLACSTATVAPALPPVCNYYRSRRIKRGDFYSTEGAKPCLRAANLVLIAQKNTITWEN